MTSFIIDKLLTLPGILIGLSLHEFGHAYTAYKLGDESQKYRGRLSIDPLKHLDPIGFLLLLVVGFGWAKPVQFDPRSFKNPRRDDSIVALAGPLMNLIVAVAMGLIFGALILLNRKGIIQNNQVFEIILTIISNAIAINLSLMVFNLIPIPPLDGHYVFANIFGAKVWNFYYKYADYLRFGLILCIVLNFTSYILGPIVTKLYGYILYFSLHLFGV